MDDWENADPDKIDAQVDLAMRSNSNKWEGEDEEEEVLESWEDTLNEEKKDVEKPAEAPKAKPKPKRTLAKNIEEKERKDREEAERKAKEREETLTPEQKAAEKLRRQKLQKEADLRLAMETFGVEEGVLIPDNAEEFKEYGDALMEKLNVFNKHNDYPAFAEELIKNISITLPATSLRKIKTMVESLHTEKIKMEKEKSKGKSKNKSKAKLKIEDDGQFNNFVTYDNEYDEFM